MHLVLWVFIVLKGSLSGLISSLREHCWNSIYLTKQSVSVPQAPCGIHKYTTSYSLINTSSCDFFNEKPAIQLDRHCDIKTISWGKVLTQLFSGSLSPSQKALQKWILCFQRFTVTFKWFLKREKKKKKLLYW